MILRRVDPEYSRQLLINECFPRYEVSISGRSFLLILIRCKEPVLLFPIARRSLSSSKWEGTLYLGGIIRACWIHPGLSAKSSYYSTSNNYFISNDNSNGEPHVVEMKMAEVFSYFQNFWKWWVSCSSDWILITVSSLASSDRLSLLFYV